MKPRVIGLLVAAALLCVSSVSYGAPDGARKIAFNLWGGGMISANGDFGANLSTGDVVKNGQSFSGTWQYFPWEGFGFQAGYALGWMPFEEEHRPEAGKTPAFVVHQITVGGVYNFANLVGSNARVRPFIGAGVGLYPFRITEDGVSGDVQRLDNGNKFQKTSFGLNTSAGLEVVLMRKLSLIGGVHYDYLFSKDTEKFGPNSEFDNQGLLNFGLGLSYRLPFSN